MNRIFLIIAISVLLFSSVMCSQKSQKNDSNNDNDEPANWLSVDELYAIRDSLSEQTVYVSGVIDHVCKHSRKRFKITDAGGEYELKVELGSEFSTVDVSILGKLVNVTGKLVPVQMNAKMVKSWEAKHKRNHKGEEESEHYKKELTEIKEIHAKIVSGDIPFYTSYFIQAEKYDFQ